MASINANTGIVFSWSGIICQSVGSQWIYSHLIVDLASSQNIHKSESISSWPAPFLFCFLAFLKFTVGGPVVHCITGLWLGQKTAQLSCFVQHTAKMPKFCKSAKNAFKASEDFIVSCLCHDDQKTLLISILQHDSLKRGEVNNSKSPAKNRTPSVTMHMICLCLILWEIIKYLQLSNISVKSVTWSCIFFLFCHFRMNFATHLLLVCRAVLCCVF